MFVYLARSGGSVILPRAVRVDKGEQADRVFFVDEEGAIVAIFARADVAMYSLDELPDTLAADESSDQSGETQPRSSQ